MQKIIEVGTTGGVQEDVMNAKIDVINKVLNYMMQRFTELIGFSTCWFVLVMICSNVFSGQCLYYNRAGFCLRIGQSLFQTPIRFTFAAPFSP